MDKQLQLAIQTVVQEEGIEKVEDEKVFLALFADLVPGYTQGKKILGLAYKEEIVRDLYKMYKQNQNLTASKVSPLKQRLMTNYMMDEIAAKEVVWNIWCGITGNDVDKLCPDSEAKVVQQTKNSDKNGSNTSTDSGITQSSRNNRISDTGSKSREQLSDTGSSKRKPVSNVKQNNNKSSKKVFVYGMIGLVVLIAFVSYKSVKAGKERGDGSSKFAGAIDTATGQEIPYDSTAESTDDFNGDSSNSSDHIVLISQKDMELFEQYSNTLLVKGDMVYMIVKDADSFTNSAGEEISINYLNKLVFDENDSLVVDKTYFASIVPTEQDATELYDLHIHCPEENGKTYSGYTIAEGVSYYTRDNVVYEFPSEKYLKVNSFYADNYFNKNQFLSTMSGLGMDVVYSD